MQTEVTAVLNLSDVFLCGTSSVSALQLGIPIYRGPYCDVIRTNVDCLASSDVIGPCGLFECASAHHWVTSSDLKNMLLE